MDGIVSTHRLLALWEPDSELLSCKSRVLTFRKKRPSQEGERALTARMPDAPCVPKVDENSGRLQLRVRGRRSEKNTRLYKALIKDLETPVQTPTPPPTLPQPSPQALTLARHDSVLPSSVPHETDEDLMSLMLTHRSVSVLSSSQPAQERQASQLQKSQSRHQPLLDTQPQQLPSVLPSVSLPCDLRRSYNRISDQQASISAAGLMLQKSLHFRHPANYMQREGKSVNKFIKMLRRTLLRNVPRPVFQKVEMGPADPILGLSVAYAEDTHPKKVNLGVGAYRDDAGKPYVLSCVREAEKRICGQMDHEYAGITGVPKFVKVAQELLFSNKCPALADARTCSSQTISGTGALRVAAQFLGKYFPGEKTIYMPSPTWGNHDPVFNESGLNVKPYTYYEPTSCGLDLDAMLKDLREIPDGSIILLHACAHNPTGVDPTPEQWHQIEAVVKEKNHYPFFDSAYQGFASGCPETDAYAIRYFVEKGHEMMVTQSFAKNLGLYGERIGAMHIVCSDKAEKANVESQLKILIRPMYSNPPIYGARLVHTIFEDAELRADWEKEVKVMADRIIGMRKALTAELLALGSTKDWSHIEKQIGMFCFTGLSKPQVERMKKEFHIYLTGNGRISMAGVTSGNVKHIAEAIHEVSQ